MFYYIIVCYFDTLVNCSISLFNFTFYLYKTEKQTSCFA